MSDCVCGFDPPDSPNPDCERCTLIVDRDRYRAALESVRADLDYLMGLWGAEAITRRIADRVKAALEPTP